MKRSWTHAQGADRGQRIGARAGRLLGDIASAQQSTSRISAEDQEFLTKAIQSGEAEVAISNLALEKSQNEQVRKFAVRMV